MMVGADGSRTCAGVLPELALMLGRGLLSGTLNPLNPDSQGSTPPELVNRWGSDTLEHYLGLYQSPEAPAAGRRRCSPRKLQPQEDDLQPGLRRMRTLKRCMHAAGCGVRGRLSSLRLDLLPSPPFNERRGGADQRIPAVPRAGAGPRVGTGGAALQVGGDLGAWGCSRWGWLLQPGSRARRLSCYVAGGCAMCCSTVAVPMLLPGHN